MKTLMTTKSQNGFYGYTIICEDDSISFNHVLQGHLMSLGTTNGMSCYQFVPGTDNNYVYIGIYEPVYGGVVLDTFSHNSGSDTEFICHVRNYALLSKTGSNRIGSRTRSRGKTSYEYIYDGYNYYINKDDLIKVGLLEPDPIEEVPLPEINNNIFIRTKGEKVLV